MELYQQLTATFPPPVESSRLGAWWYGLCRNYEGRYPRWLSHAMRSLDDWWREEVLNRVSPPNGWVGRAVRRSYQDIDQSIQDVLFAAVVQYVSPDGEDGLRRNSWYDPEWGVDKRAEANKLAEIYLWATKERALTELRMNDAWYPGEIDIGGGSKTSVAALFVPETERGSYEEYTRLSDLIEATDKQHCEWIVQRKGILWT